MSATMLYSTVRPTSVVRTATTVPTVRGRKASLKVCAAWKDARESMWYPGATPPAHLDGTMPGDYGFDPLRLGTNKDLLPWYKEAELTNGRWAMMAVAGILFTDAFGLPKFWLAGAEQYAIGFVPLLAIEIVVMGLLEYQRFKGWKETGKSGFLSFFPFDPMGMASDEMSYKEVKNGRLAMIAFLGFCSQAAVRGMGPIDCLKSHIADPWNNNIFTSSVGPEVTIAVVVASLAPLLIEAKKGAGDESEEEFRPIPW
eukprot:TRINITY_DN245_c0_g2_i1.p2 TRINITY_DN245_c0_g2~~TRINITY_DN245_c0_g2_i1.p2  ORF type:complete len:298 (-),score=70.25 TRINITY_DN245_c0_g2_i1:233-1000(-)